MQNESTRLRDIEIQSKVNYLLKTEVIMMRNSRWKVIEENEQLWTAPSCSDFFCPRH